MKPIKLTISAFGPYSKEVQINFEDFAAEGLFLVTGDTGAGKTTIFDAISFALYGEASGGNVRRESKSFRSDYANPDTPTYVELTFCHRGKEYNIKRNPEYERPAKRGAGMVKEAAAVEFHMPDRDKVLTKSKEVESEIISLLGLDREQFSQTVMIAQGDFMKILRAKSDERKKLFQKIFNTSKYEQLENLLKEKNSTLEKIHARADEDIAAAISMILIDTDFEKAAQLQEEKQPAKALELIRSLIEFQKSKLDKLAADAVKITEKTESKSKEFGLYQQINNDFHMLEQAKKTKADLESKSEEIKLKEERIRLARAAQAAAPAVKLYNASAAGVKNLNTSIEAARKSIKECEESAKFARSDFDRAKEKYGTLELLKKQADDLEAIIPVIRSFSKSEAEFAAAEEKQKAAFIASKNADAKYIKVKENFYSGQSAIIAKELKEGQPCPVCGSLEHPAPAEAAGKLATKEELEFADSTRKEAEIQLQQATGKATEAKLIYEQKKQLIMEAEMEESDAAQLEKQAESIRENIKNIKAVYEKTAESLQNAKVALENEKGALSAAEKQLEREKKILQKNLKELNASLAENGFADVKSYNAAGLDLKTLDNLEKETADYYTKSASTKDRIMEYENKLQGKKQTDLSVLETEILELKNQATAVSAEIRSLQSRHDANKTNEDKIEVKLKEKSATAKEYAIVNELYKTVSGNLGGGKAKLKFESYVQQFYFNQVVACANQRLKVLSEGNFHLRLKQETTNLRSQAGLDLEVFDANSCAWRDVSTLSGGESFVASLALALGLSDMAQSKSGQIKLDSMFIDEGFGTLDENTLHQAMEVLSKLACGNRLIGVISHVSELKHRIDKQIIIRKTRTGSEIEIVKG